MINLEAEAVVILKDRLFESSKIPLKVESKKVLSGIFAVLDQFNQNGRRYPRKVYEAAYKQIAPKISERRLLGELDHPIEYDEIRLSNVSHVVTECQILDSGEVVGKVELLDTPSGLVAQALVEAGIPLGISSRGLGSTTKVGEGVEVTNLKLITFDLVADPGFSQAILLNESAYNKLQNSLNRIEESLPLNESNGDDNAVRELIHKIRESVKVKQEKEDEEEDIVSLIESLEEEDKESLKETIQIYKDKVANLENIVEAREEELRIQGKFIKDMQRIIENLKTRLQSAGVPSDEVASLVESVGTLTIDNTTKEEALQSLIENMESLQEEYNRVVEELKSTTEALISKTEELNSIKERFNEISQMKESLEYEKDSLESEIKVLESEKKSLETEVVNLRKRLAVEVRGLSWDKVSSLLEGLTTEREINEKLDSLVNLSNSFNSFSPERVVKTLTESASLSGHANRLSSIISRV